MGDARKHAECGSNVGLLTGELSDGIVALDRDVDYPATVARLGDLARTVKVVRSNAPDRGKLLYRVDGSLPPSRAYKINPTDKHPAAELLSMGRHALIPPSEFEGGRYELVDADLGILTISPDALAHIWWMITGLDLYKGGTLRADAHSLPPAPRQNGNDDFMAQVKAAWTPAKVFAHFGKDANGIQTERGRHGEETRILGNGGLLVQDWRWYCHSDGVGGDVIDAWAWCNTGKPAPRRDGRGFLEIVRDMALAAGIAFPEHGTSNGDEVDAIEAMLDGNFVTAAQREADANAPDEEPGDPSVKPLENVFAAPSLPALAQLTEEQMQQAIPVGAWLKLYLRFATEASPMSPALFHVCAGITALSVAVARRVSLRRGTRKIYPNVYILFVGPSTKQRKTEGMNVLEGLMQAAGMQDAFLLPERVTPEAFIDSLSLSVPQTLNKWSPDAQQAWLAQRSLHAQRGWLLDEASHLLDSFKRDYSSGLLPLVLDLYESKDRAGGRQGAAGWN